MNTRLYIRRQHLRLCECAIMLVRLVCPRPLLFCSIVLDASKQKKIVYMARILFARLVECGRFRECLGNNPGFEIMNTRLYIRRSSM
jgi:hypothetical protein